MRNGANVWTGQPRGRPYVWIGAYVGIVNGYLKRQIVKLMGCLFALGIVARDSENIFSQM